MTTHPCITQIAPAIRNFDRRAKLIWVAALVLAFLPAAAFGVVVHPEITTSEDDSTVIVNDAPEQDVIVIGKSVIIQKRVKGVLAVGGDVIIEGRVEGDVATVGGNVIQKENAYIAGDVIVFGGAYKPESAEPYREPGKETVMFGMFEEELRAMGQNPSSILSPSMSLTFVAQRIFIALFWFVIAILFTTLAPGAVSRAAARVQLSWLKVLGLGSVAFILTAAVIVSGSLVLPNYLSVTLALMGMLMLLLGFVFGRVVLQVSAGKLIQKHIFGISAGSETLALLIGVLAWTLLLSLPYIWILAVFVNFAAGIGLVLTGRTSTRWQNP